RQEAVYMVDLRRGAPAGGDPRRVGRDDRGNPERRWRVYVHGPSGRQGRRRRYPELAYHGRSAAAGDYDDFAAGWDRREPVRAVPLRVGRHRHVHLDEFRRAPHRVDDELLRHDRRDADRSGNLQLYGDRYRWQQPHGIEAAQYYGRG